MPVDRLLHPRLLNSLKICELTHLEYRVWQTYVLVADDFGVMPMNASQIMVSRAFKRDRPRSVSAALERCVTLRLVARFDDQSLPYIWTPTWQFHQRIRYPRREETYFPPPPESDLEALTEPKTAPTRALFATFHLQVSEGFRQRYGDPDELLKIAIRKDRKRGPHSGNSPGSVSGIDQNHPAPRVHARDAGAGNGIRHTATGQGPTADGEDGQAAFMRFQAAYPEQRRKGGRMVQEAFLHQIRLAGGSAALFAALANHQASEQWRDPNMVPGMDTWLTEERWRQVLPARGSVAESSRQRPAWAQKPAAVKP